MNILFVLDKDAKTGLSEDLKRQIILNLEVKGHRFDVYELGKNDVTQCLGCLLCLTKHAGECAVKDTVNELRKNVKQYDATFFLTPILFGHYSSTMASPLNKATGSHKWQVLLGYGEGLNEEEKNTFIDLTAKHRGKMDIVHPGMDKQVDVFVSQSLEDNRKICESLKVSAG
jgi:hypothetical protein